jgi:hypothetical protein
LALIEAMATIASSIQPCSVRALAYQLFNRKLIPSMALKYTRKVSELCVIAREEGRIPWEWITDSTRVERRVPTWSDPVAYADTVQRLYRRNKWDYQRIHVSIWSEKATIEGVVQPVLDEYGVSFRVLHGWCGSTPVWDAAYANFYRHRDTLILYVGDYDPSGLYMSEVDLPKRLARYSSGKAFDKDIDLERARRLLADNGLEIRRIALTAEDTVALGMETHFPVSSKERDPRYRWFVQNYGHRCWELDALSPNVLRDRIGQAIMQELDLEMWNRSTRVEEAERRAIIDTCRAWGSISVPDQE